MARKISEKADGDNNNVEPTAGNGSGDSGGDASANIPNGDIDAHRYGVRSRHVPSPDTSTLPVEGDTCDARPIIELDNVIQGGSVLYQDFLSDEMRRHGIPTNDYERLIPPQRR